jgi:pyruvate-ferredoxin/flavodoxin oxidoreductase
MSSNICTSNAGANRVIKSTSLRKPNFKTIDANEVMAIYPITPSSPMAEWCDQWASEGKPNLWETIPAIFEMQSESGAVANVHGALQTGSMATTFTAPTTSTKGFVAGGLS